MKKYLQEIGISEPVLSLIQTFIGGSTMASCGSLWKGKTSKGKTFLSGTISLGVLGEANIMIFPNEKKSKPQQPDYFILSKNGEKPKEKKKEDEDL